jgi:phosphoglycerol transferase MdoB-like AlkP superfamily enzyme
LLADQIRIIKILNKIYYFTGTILLTALNLMDVEYFKYTSKRSTFDLFTVLGAGSDFKQLVWTFITDFWFLIVFLIALIWLINKLYQATETKSKTTSKNTSTTSSKLIWGIIALAFFVVVGRGGIQLKPVGIIEAAHFTIPENTAIVLNTGFTMIKSYGKERLDQKNYFSPEKERQLFNPVRTSEPQEILPKNTNVVFIILESFGEEFTANKLSEKSYTPFLDSLRKESLSFEYGFANGKKSIEAVPAIIASVPSLMDNPYISSPYGNNQIRSLAHILKEHGYSTAFYHGATNGSMRFDSFAAQAGFDEYFGRFEYGNDEHFDQTWGILDEYFNSWSARKMSKQKQPFFATLFTLSSHHPYFIPDHQKLKVKKGPQKICASINYGDISLRKFFDEAKSQPWYENTLFVLCADHTPSTNSSEFNKRELIYRIPILFYHPQGKITPENSSQIFQQLDIMPTVIDMLGINTEYYAFGNSLYSLKEREAYAYLEGSYYYFNQGYMLTFSDDKSRALNRFSSHQIENKNKKNSNLNQKRTNFENRLKAIIQRYNRDLVQNQTKIQ